MSRIYRRLVLLLVLVIIIYLIISLQKSSLFFQNSYSEGSLDIFQLQIQLQVSEPERVKYGNFTVFPNLIRSKNEEIDSIMLTLHSSFPFSEKQLQKMARAWNSRISLAIFSRNSSNEMINEVIKQLRTLSSLKDLENVTMHLFFEDLPQKTRANRQLYPANVARNIARKFAPDHRYFLTADMDQIYSLEAERRLFELAEKREISKNDEVHVIRRFEHEEETSAPRTMMDLKNRLDKDVFVFHSFTFSKGHFIPGLRDWLERNFSLEGSYVAYDHAEWEPMFVAPSRVPDHPEEVLYGWRDHSSSCWDLCVLSYRFFIVDGVFSSHQGVKRKTAASSRNPIAVRAGREYQQKLVKDFPKIAPKCLGLKAMSLISRT